MQTLSDMFPIKNGMKQDDALSPLLPKDEPTRFTSETKHKFRKLCISLVSVV